MAPLPVDEEAIVDPTERLGHDVDQLIYAEAFMLGVMWAQTLLPLMRVPNANEPTELPRVRGAHAQVPQAPVLQRQLH